MCVFVHVQGWKFYVLYVRILIMLCGKGINENYPSEKQRLLIPNFL